MDTIDRGLPGSESTDHSNPQSGLLTTPEAALYLGLGVGTLEKDRVSGRLAIPYVKLGKAVRYDPLDLNEWKQARKRCSTAERAA